VRAALSEIVVRVEAEHIEMILHWQGGDHTALKVKKNAPLDDTRGYPVTGPRVGAADAGSANRTAPQPRRQADRAR
jgi:hypothetical protein